MRSAHTHILKVNHSPAEHHLKQPNHTQSYTVPHSEPQLKYEVYTHQHQLPESQPTLMNAEQPMNAENPHQGLQQYCQSKQLPTTKCNK